MNNGCWDVDWGVPCALVLLPLLAGCTGGGVPDFDVTAYNNTGESVTMRFRATFDETGEVIFDETALVAPGYAHLGHLRGPRGNYHLEAWALGLHDELGPGFGMHESTTCGVYVANPDPVRIACIVP